MRHSPKFLLTLLSTTLPLHCLDFRSPPHSSSTNLPTLLSVLPYDSLPAKLPRTPRFILTFDHHNTLTPQDLQPYLHLLTGEPSSALLSDASNNTFSSTNASRLVPTIITQSLQNPSQFILSATQSLLPDTPLTLLIPQSTILHPAFQLTPDDTTDTSLPRVFTFTIAPARLCGPVPTLASSIHISPNTRTVHLSLDRPSLGEPIAYLSPLSPPSSEIPLDTVLSCLTPSGARCVRITLGHSLIAQQSYTLTLTGLHSRTQTPIEILPFTLITDVTTTTTPHLSSPVCARDEVSLPPLCLLPTAQGITVRTASTTPSTAVLSLHGPEVLSRGAISPWSSTHTLSVRTLDTFPQTTPWSLSVTLFGTDGTATDVTFVSRWIAPIALPEVHITEVLARPRTGSAQEFIELTNDSDTTVSLRQWSLTSGSSRSAFPDAAVINQHQSIVVVGPDFDPRGALHTGDPPLAPGATVITLSLPLAGHGLRDSGADVSLVSPDGRIASTVPLSHPLRTPRLGISLVRTDPDLDDLDPAAWTYDSNNSATPGAPDRLR